MKPEQKRLFVIIGVKLILKKYFEKRRIKEINIAFTESGAEYVKRLMLSNSNMCEELMRVNGQVFLNMCALFREKGWLQDSRYISVEEKMATFMFTLNHNLRSHFVKQRFKHSSQMMSKYFHDVLRAMLHFSKEMIMPPSFDEDSLQFQTHTQLRQVFKGAVGALDGILVNAYIPRDSQISYLPRGGRVCCQNVLAICDFNMIFTFVWAGWEGAAHDSQVLMETMSNPENNFPLPPSDKYYLCDDAYMHTRGFMTPYRNARYWLPDFRDGPHPTTKEEKFNYAHAKLRNVIERAFGVLKARFPILKTMPPYDFPTQRNIVIACVAIHNFIRRSAIMDKLFEQYEDEDVRLEYDNIQTQDMPVTNEETTPFDQTFMYNLRDQIASELVVL
ncbi:PREDICTED: putative nuclease HARBI1 isoform X1 [Nelumbo nucifera]|uniref:Nuclease HARBI1 isoform X1 n=1 Tax=Nelumbo nucifera TaxID=4432 RepID=A0A1U8B932_NELNU|nr:PREDICTED: putative nuclease HARBI1 isoform X1 [Nelumbo nucifera]XP_010276162.1 PREDICTED: putative nuclease HARBI1 isoform X1 [Nelumbo nucifera]XP_010276163.1 PREDICTED: putative nuclease HARBI1 isoform X1 [Nelumbo nucifera]